jgi:hypothetical protein
MAALPAHQLPETPVFDENERVGVDSALPKRDRWIEAFGPSTGTPEFVPLSGQ